MRRQTHLEVILIKLQEKTWKIFKIFQVYTRSDKNNRGNRAISGFTRQQQLLSSDLP